MTRRITCYVVFATLIWGAQTHTEESRQDIFKSNMTRNDFSNLLSSLIKLNEQRVKVLQKLYHLEDYGILSEVLRSGDKKIVNGNPSNLFLIVMSKQGPVDAKHIIQKYQKLRDNEESLLTEDKEPAEDGDERYDLVGLVTLEDNASVSDSAGIEDESEEDEDIILEVRSQKKTKKKHESNTRRRNSKIKGKKTHHNALRERDETEKAKKVLKAKCLSEINYKVVKCIQACHRTHEDVCSRLACSVRSRRELRKECDNSCRQTFVSEAC